MNDQHDEQGRRGFSWGIAFGLALPLLYVLSIGPVGALLNALSIRHTHLLGKVALVFYYPVTWPMRHSDAYREWLIRYSEFWHDLFRGV